MSRAIGIAFVLALTAGSARAEEAPSAYDRAQNRLTEQLNTVISKGVELGKSAPPAKPDDGAEKQPPAPGARGEPLARR